MDEHTADHAGARAVELAGQGRFEEADPWFLNALSRRPGDLGLIGDFVVAVQAAASERSAVEPQAAVQQLEWLADFVAERVVHVAAEDLEALLELAAQLRVRASTAREEAADARQGAGGLAAADGEGPDQAEERTARLQALRTRPPESAARLSEAIVELEAEPPGDAVDEVLQRLRVLLAVEGLLTRGEVLLEAAAHCKDLTEAAYVLAGAEGILREAYPHLPELDAHRKRSLRRLRRKLEERSEETAQLQEVARSAKAWKAWRSEHKEQVATLRGWEAPGEGVAKGGCQARIEALQELAGDLQAVLSIVRSGKAGAAAVKLMGQLGDALEEAREHQHRQYNTFAMKKVVLAYTVGCEQIGMVTDDKEKLASLLVRHLGKVDQRLLTHEVQRTYSEVFEYLFGKLDPPKAKGDSFGVEGNKLNLIRRMADQKKRQLEDF